VENARLSLQAELATDYLQLRGTDAQIALYEEAIKAYQTNYQLTLNRYNAGVAGKSDVVQAETQLKTAQAQAIDLRPTRAQLEHAIAVLVGKPPAEINIEPMHTEERVPAVPPGLPSTLLQRRPDVAAAERRAAAANARIGVAQAAYFPTLSLTGALGFESTSLPHLISAPNRYWTLGASAAETLLDFGARAADVETARAAYDQAVADYRQAVLQGFQEVEDDLATVHWLADEAVVQSAALGAARESVRLTLNQYKAGTASYLDVTLVQATQFAAERSTVDLLQRRLVANVALVRALGGSWSAQ
jgi:NodT family efflux transporter outer membrane factor (OMF) lipoprotein